MDCQVFIFTGNESQTNRHPESAFSLGAFFCLLVTRCGVSKQGACLSALYDFYSEEVSY